MPWRRDFTALCLTQEQLQRICRLVPFLQGKQIYTSGKNRLHDFGGFLIRVLQCRICWMFPHNFQGYQVIHSGFCHKNIIFNNGRNLIPLRLVPMTESSAEAHPVKQCYSPKEHKSVEAVLKPWGKKCYLWKPHSRNTQQCLSCNGAKRHIGNISQENPHAVILVEKNIR